MSRAEKLKRQRFIARAVAAAHSRKKCSSCGEKKPYVQPWKNIQLCRDCVVRIQEKYGTPA